jgi:crotonobetainyl-CoA:carnitine CoA-transferase CaiB-like acyl-CoA transferase
MRATLPLDGVRVLAFSQFGAGPFATLNLADQGAEVIKIEDPHTGGDVSRLVPPYRIEGDSLYFQSWNRNKRSITLDLRIREGMNVFHDLVRISHVVFNNLRGDQPAKLGLSYGCLKDFNAKIVCCSLSGFGSTGPNAGDPGYDYLMQASAGYMSMTGDPSSPPAACGVSFIDHAAGFAAAFGMASALLSAERTGKGRDVEVTLFDTAYSMLTYLAMWNLNRGFRPERHSGSAHQSLVPVQTFRTSDGYITVFCGKEKFWKLLCEEFGDAALARDPAAQGFEARYRNRTKIVEAVGVHFLRKTTAEWVERLAGKVPCAPVRDLTQALAQEDLQQRGTIVEVEHPTFGKLREVNTPVRAGAQTQQRSAPTLGEDNDSIFRDLLHYDDQAIERLRSAGAI